jgi:coenzyme PQQ synthesis protein D (PqqD)
MTDRSEQQLPVARREGLLVEKLPDEVLVYDLDRKKAHCLNSTAALIWNHCDGRTTIDDLVMLLQKQSKGKVQEDVVWFGLDQLRTARLIEGQPTTPAGKQRLSRRELVKKIGLAVSIPIIVSVLAPQASAALSCAHVGCVPCNPPCSCIGGNCQ